MDIEFDYKSIPTIRKFSRSDTFIRGLMGPFGSAKSSGCVMEILKRGLRQEPGRDGKRKSRWAVIRNTYRQLEDTTIRTFFNWIPPGPMGKWHATKHQFVIKPSRDIEIEILFRALDRPEHVSNLLSLELTGAWVNEAREVPWAIIEALMGRVKRFPAMLDGGPTWSGIILDTNPPGDDSWWYKKFEVERPKNFEIFKQPSGLSRKAENKPNLPENYYEDLSFGMDQESVKVYVHGEYGFLKDGRPVYGDYNDTLHCQEADPVQGVIVRGWDFGLTPACVFTQILPDGRWLIFDEMMGEGGIDSFSSQVNEHCRVMYPQHSFEDVGDPAGEQRAQTDEKTCFQILRAKNIFIQSGVQDLTARIESVSKPLRTLIDGKPQFILHPRCQMLRKGFLGRYQYKKLRYNEDRYHLKPDKNDYSHPQDALQYVGTKIFFNKLRVVRRGPTPQPDIKVI